MSHTGRPLIRYSRDRVMVLCPYGHLYVSVHERDWAGSWMEANVGDPKYTVTCDGTVRTEDKG